MTDYKTYFEKRIYGELGITEELNHIQVNRLSQYAHLANGQDYFFLPGKDDGIDISYLRLDGYFQQFTPSGSRYEQHFRRTRISPHQIIGDNTKYRYYQPAKSGVHIFLTPGIIEKYNAGTKIETLVATEGEFKTFKGYMHGLDIIGIGGRDLFKQKGENILHPTLMEILRVCKPDNLLYLLDADCMDVKWEEWEADPDYDLGKRLNDFYCSVKTFRDLAKNFTKDIYFAYIKKEEGNENSPKGLDDLYVANKGEEQAITDDLLKLSSSKRFFKCKNISDESPSKIREMFFLTRTREGLPQIFYNEFSHKLSEKEFVFIKARYQYNHVDGFLQMKQHEDSGRFIRVGCNYLKIIHVPELVSGIRVNRRKLEPWKSGEISRDYVNKGFKNFFDTINKYDAFTNYPDNTEKFNQIIDECYNLYYPLQYTPKKGKWKTIAKYLSHIFGSKFRIGMDFLKLLYLHPTQKLPILALVSEERGTGKTKFIELLREIFSENVTILGNDDITDNYNDDYASKLVICIDEGLIEKRVTVEKIKSWSTARRIKMNTKFLSRQEIPFFGKIVVTSNNEDSFMPVEDQETRFFVLKVPVIKKENPKILEEMIEEIPAFLYYLLRKKMFYPEKTRHWFDYFLLQTDALTKIKASSQSWLVKEIKTMMSEMFFKYQYHRLYYTLTELTDMLNMHAGVKYRKAEIQKQLKEKFKVEAHLGRYEFADEPNQSLSRTHTEKIGRCYEFLIEQFLTDKEIIEIGYDLEKIKLARMSQGDIGFPQEAVSASKTLKNDDLPF